MEYAIIEKLAGLAAAGLGPSFLAGTVRLFKEAFRFDYCGIYAWVEQKEEFVLDAWCGESVGCVRRYNGDEGAAALAREQGSVIELHGHGKHASTLPGGGTDKGGEGYSTILVYPLVDSVSFWGVLYLKSKRPRRLSPEARRAMATATKQLTVAIRCAEMRESMLAARKELSEMQAWLARSEKLLSLADMASTLAHEIRSPLISIGGFTERLKKKVAAGSPLMTYVSQIEKETHRLEKLINGMIGFLRETPVELVADDMNDIMAEALRCFDDDLSAHGIDLVKDLYGGPLRVLADRDQLKIAFDNLIANAIQSMETGGRLVVRTTRAGGSVTVCITDSGNGIDPEIINNIFNPFFTTKSSGTGLGLPITNSIVTRHHGVISVSNNTGAGVTFELNLPEAAPEDGPKA